MDKDLNKKLVRRRFSCVLKESEKETNFSKHFWKIIYIYFVVIVILIIVAIIALIILSYLSKSMPETNEYDWQTIYDSATVNCILICVSATFSLVFAVGIMFIHFFIRLILATVKVNRLSNDELIEIYKVKPITDEEKAKAGIGNDETSSIG